MKFLPFKDIVIESHLNKDEVRSRLEKRIGVKQTENFKRVDSNYFTGRLEDDEFELKPIFDHYNSWRPIVKGDISDSGTGCKMTIKIRMESFVLIFTSVFLTIGLIFLGTEIFKSLSAGYFMVLLIILVVFTYGLPMIFFNAESEQCISDLLKVSEGEIDSAR